MTIKLTPDRGKVTTLDFTDFSELIISGGVITVTQSCHTIDTEDAAATDDLDTINGGSNGMMIVLKASNDSRTVTIKHNTGNIWLKNKADIDLDDVEDGILLIYDGAYWFDIAPIAGIGDMTKAVYDPDADGVIALDQLDTLVCSEAEADSKITTHKNDASYANSIRNRNSATYRPYHYRNWIPTTIIYRSYGELT